MKKILLAAALAIATPAHAQVHYPIITVTGNVTIIDTGIHETFAGVTYDERLYIMGSWQGYNNPMVDSESAEWFPISAPTPIVPPPPCCDPPPFETEPPGGWNPPIYIPPPCDECGFPKPSPVPEPSTWAMLLIGFVGLGYAYLRRKRLA